MAAERRARRVMREELNDEALNNEHRQAGMQEHAIRFATSSPQRQASMLNGLSLEELSELFKRLDHDDKILMFEMLSSEMQEALLELLTPEQAAMLFPQAPIANEAEGFAELDLEDQLYLHMNNAPCLPN